MPKKVSVFIIKTVKGQKQVYRRTLANQCRAKLFFSGARCQGCSGHKGPHWAYGESGTLRLSKNKRDTSREWRGIASKHTPPGHKDYISPEKLARQCYRTYYRQARVTDKATVKRILAGKLRVGELLTSK